MRSLTDQMQPPLEQVEYRSCWVPRIGACAGHVHFMLFVSISFALGNAVSGGIWA